MLTSESQLRHSTSYLPTQRFVSRMVFELVQTLLETIVL